jgi:hypothetical protein
MPPSLPRPASRLACLADNGATCASWAVFSPVIRMASAPIWRVSTWAIIGEVADKRQIGDRMRIVCWCAGRRAFRDRALFAPCGSAGGRGISVDSLGHWGLPCSGLGRAVCWRIPSGRFSSSKAALFRIKCAISSRDFAWNMQLQHLRAGRPVLCSTGLAKGLPPPAACPREPWLISSWKIRLPGYRHPPRSAPR